MDIGNFILIAVMISVVVVLMVGIGFMAKGGDANRKYGNKMMVLRVSLQGLALCVLGVLFFMKS